MVSCKAGVGDTEGIGVVETPKLGVCTVWRELKWSRAEKYWRVKLTEAKKLKMMVIISPVTRRRVFMIY